MEEPTIKRAITTKTISGPCIETIHIGTEFDIIIWPGVVPLSENIRYYPCKGLGITSIWSDEFKFL